MHACMPLQLVSYWEPPDQTAAVSGFETSFPAGPNHTYTITMDADPSIVTYAPNRQLSLLNGYGTNYPPVVAGRDVHREVMVVLKPFHNLKTKIFGPLLERHVEYYQVGYWVGGCLLS